MGKNMSRGKHTLKDITFQLPYWATIILRLLDQIWQVKYNSQPLSQNSINILQRLALYAGFWTSNTPKKPPG